MNNKVYYGGSPDQSGFKRIRIDIKQNKLLKISMNNNKYLIYTKCILYTNLKIYIYIYIYITHFFYKQPHFRVEPRVAIKIPKMKLKVAMKLLSISGIRSSRLLSFLSILGSNVWKTSKNRQN